MSNLQFLNQLTYLEGVFFDKMDVISSAYYPDTDIYDFIRISFSLEFVHWVFITDEGQHISDAKPIKAVFDLLEIQL